MRQADDPDSRAYLQGHLDQVARQQAAADSARRVGTLLEQEASLARRADETLASEDDPAPIRKPPFDVVGMLQPSSKLAAGRKVYAVIGEEGYAVAYLRVPPGLLMEPLLSRQVGVRGSFSYDPALRQRGPGHRDRRTLPAP